LKILVWGLGYVGTVTAACLAYPGHQVVGIEPNLSKVTILSAGDRSVKEPGLDALVKKDVRSLTFHARQLDIDLPIIEGILPSNRVQTEAARLKILNTGLQRVGILGLSFKPNTDDLRESPAIGLMTCGKMGSM